MKRIISLLLTAALALTLCACVTSKTPMPIDGDEGGTAAERVTVRLGGLKGPTSMGMVKLLEDGDKYGYQMTSELRQRSEDVFHLKAGTLYPLLHSLEEKGLVTAYEREAAAGKPRRYYHLTKAGEAALREKETAWHTYADAVGRVLGGGACCAGT